MHPFRFFNLPNISDPIGFVETPWVSNIFAVPSSAGLVQAHGTPRRVSCSLNTFVGKSSILGPTKNTITKTYEGLDMTFVKSFSCAVHLSDIHGLIGDT